MNGKLSANEVMLELSRVYLIPMGARKVLLEVTKEAEDIERIIGKKLLSKILRS